MHICSLTSLILKVDNIKQGKISDDDKKLTIEKYITCRLQMCFRRAVVQTYLNTVNQQKMAHNVKMRNGAYPAIKNIFRQWECLKEHINEPPFKKIHYTKYFENRITQPVCFLFTKQKKK